MPMGLLRLLLGEVAYHVTVIPANVSTKTDNHTISAVMYPLRAPHLRGTHSPFPLRSFSSVHPRAKLTSVHTLEAPRQRWPAHQPFSGGITNRRSALTYRAQLTSTILAWRPPIYDVVAVLPFGGGGMRLILFLVWRLERHCIF